MSTVRKLHHVSIDDYLASERASEVRHEYVDGQVYAMVGASKRHNRIALALASALRSHLTGGPCATFVSDIKVKAGRAFYYPDIAVSCHGGKGDEHYEAEPLLIVEVLSESTEARDRFEKRIAYQRLESLKEYVLVAQDRVEVEVYRRLGEIGGDEWEVETYTRGDRVHLRSVDLGLPIETIYEDVIGAMGQ